MLVMAVVNRSSSNAGFGSLEANTALVRGVGTIGNDLFGHGALRAGPAVVHGNATIELFGSGVLHAGLARVIGSGIVGAENYQTPSYSNAGGTGNRTSIITVTTDATLGGSSGAISRLVDGGKANGSGTAAWFVSGQSNRQVTFQFGNKVKITEAKWFQNGTSPQGGTWKWRGSNDGATFTDLSAAFTLDAGATGAVIGDLSANNSGFLFYRLQQTGGNTSDAPWLWECEFKIGNLT